MELKDIAKKRQQKRKETDLYKVVEDPNKPKFYILDMFPYPSGSALHVGHPKGFIATDAIARKKMLQGFNVLHPMGFDTFGLGTEQYAIDHKMKPQVVSEQNIAKFIQQLESFWTTYDRSRSVNTAEPKYFKWTQRVFLQMYNHYYDEKLKKAMSIASLKKQMHDAWYTIQDIEKSVNSQRLAYVDYKPINRCPKCMTGLANEDLDDGKCERCGSPVEQKPMKQRVLRITKYAERLIEGLDMLDWEESMKDLERNRIGKSEGTDFDMVIASEAKQSWNEELKFSVYTTRIDTVFGMSFVAIAPEHPLLEKIQNSEFWIQNWNEIRDYQEQAKHKTQLERTELQKEKTGVRIEWLYAINPFNGDKVPVFVADYVLANYGTGVVMAVPAHDERDFDFAKKYDIKITQSIAPYIKENHGKTGYEIHNIHSFTSIIKHPSEDKYLLIKFQNNKFWFVGWKIEWEETKADALTREIVEETGYTDFEIKEVLLENAFGLWYKPHKDRLDRAHDKVFLVHLLNEKNVGISEEEQKKHTTQRATKDEIAKLSLVDHHQFYRDTYIKWPSAYTEKWILVDSWEFTGLESDEAITKMQAWLQEKWIGGVKVNYKMQDRVFSRQRYRGEPFPILRDEDGNIVALDEKDLPVELPDVENYAPTGTEEWPLANISDRVNITKDGKQYKRETNTMPGRAGSSRYRLRYMDPKNNEALVGKDKEAYRGNVDVYVGGAEHVTRHMIYGRFRQNFLYDIGIVTKAEPFQEYHYVGLIMGEDGRKMSKRRGNVVNPDDIIAEFWTDALRTYEMFMGPFDQSIARSTSWIKGVKKFLEKVIALKEKTNAKEETNETKILLNQSIKKLTEDIDGFRFNTAISQLMILVNHLTDCPAITKKTFEDLIILVSPFAPHLAEELREQLGNEYSIFTKATRPIYDEKCLVADTITIGVQVNGKMRGTICISKDAEEKDAMDAVNSDEKIKSWITTEPKKVIYVKGKILNIVV